MVKRDFAFSVDYCKKLAKDPHSALQVVTRRRKILLHPLHLGRVRAGVDDFLGREVKRFSVWLDGVLVAYDNIHLLHCHAVSADDQPQLHATIEGDFYVFRPTLRCTLKAVVNKIHPHHISCLVHNFFTAIIQRPPEDPSWLGDQLSPGTKFLFRVIHLDFGGKIAVIKGTVLKICERSTTCGTFDKPDQNVNHNAGARLTNGIDETDDRDSISKFSEDLFLNSSPPRFTLMEPSTSVKPKTVASSDASDSSSGDKLKHPKDDEKTKETKTSPHKKKKSKKRRRSTEDEESSIALGEAQAKKKKKRDSEKHKKKKKKHGSKHKKEKKTST